MQLNLLTKYAILSFTIAVFIISAYLIEPIAQDLTYHDFADKRIIFAIPNFWNIVSNMFFVIVGVYCIYKYSKFTQEKNARYIDLCFFIGLFLTGLGSSYYHIAPDNESLVWDRLAMTVCFMALFASVIQHHINPKLGFSLFIPLLLLGITSVVYWIYTESMNAGDLRLYGFVQFTPMILIPIILIMFPTAGYQGKFIWLLILTYGLAKFCEVYDGEIYELSGIISGHSLKHIIASFTGVFYLKAVYSRKGQ